MLELRRQGLSVHEISARLRAEGTPLNRTGVGQILAEEGFGPLLRGRAPAASTSPATAGHDPAMLIMDQKVTTQAVLHGKVRQAGTSFESQTRTGRQRI